MTAPSYDPLKFGAVSFGKTDPRKANEGPANEGPANEDPATPEDLLFADANASQLPSSSELQDPSAPPPGPGLDQEDVDDGWGLAPPLPEDDYPEEVKTDSAQRRNPLTTNAAEDTRGRESAQTTSRPTQSWQQRNRSSQRPARREALPRRQDQPVHHPLRHGRSASGGAAPLLVLLVGLGGAAYLSLVAQNYPVAIFLALVSVVAAPLVRLILQSTVE